MKSPFEVYPDALTRLPGAPAWSILFFGMFVLLGIDSQMVLVEVFMTVLMDQWPCLRETKRKAIALFITCASCFLVGLVLCCPGGSHVLDLLDLYAGGWTLVSPRSSLSILVSEEKKKMI